MNAPHLPPVPRDPDRPGDEPSEFGVDLGHQRRLAARAVPPSEGGPNRALSPAAGRQSGYPGERVRG